MINLAKTPANQDFQSKYYKQPLTDRPVRNLDTTFQTPPAPPSLPASPVEGSSQNDLRNQRQSPSEEATSPDFSTSSLISCSEHYNGESLLDPGQMSPHSPSSKQNASLITSRDNRVIITINTKDKRSAETAE